MSTSILQILGKKLANVEVIDELNEVVFTLADGIRYRMGHERWCCEKVSIIDVSGDLKDLKGSWILMAEESSSGKQESDYPHPPDTWTFYKLATIKGYVTICWHGTSNGYYSTRVDFVKIGSEYDWKQWGRD